MLAKLDKAFPSYDPLLELVEIVQDPEVDLSTRVDSHKMLPSYIYPKIRTAAPAVMVEKAPIGIEIINPYN